jgi:hypothetical protein
MRSLAALLLLALPAVAAPPDFDRAVAPLLVKRCANCHSGEKPKGDLDITRKAQVIPADVWKRVAADEMPPKKPLTADEKATLKAWIDGGAMWGTDPIKLRPDPADWWSFQPLPVNREAKTSAKERGVDHFINATLKQKGLTPAPLADRRTLVRRLYFDLTGLPPIPERVTAFERDTRPDAYEKLVDELLASPRYGERWARHWLDVVHYGETHGYDKDQPRPHAWPYRDYVIRAFNADKPYARFVQEQVVGDVLFPGTEDGVTALGFLAAGPWDFIGHVELPESKIDGKVARHLDRDDFVSNTVGTFLSLTAHCAQCHDHKFDPISQREYYGLQAVFAAIDRADRVYDADPKMTAKRAELVAKRTTLEATLAKLDADARTKGGKELADAEAKLTAARKPPVVKPEYGYHSALAKKATDAKWVQVDLGKAVALDKVVLHPCWDDFNGLGAGFGFPVRYKVEVSDDAEFKKAVTLLDHTADQPNPGLTPVDVVAKGHTARYVRVTASKLASRQNDHNFALAELEVFDAAGKNAAAGAGVSSLDSIEAPPRWTKKNLTDGIFPRAVATPAEVQRLADEVRKRFADALGVERSADLKRTQTELMDVNAALGKLPPPAGRVYAGSVHTGSGNFVGTGASGGKPRPIHILPRGDVTKPGKEVAPAALAFLPVKFEVKPTAPEGERRAALANWLTDKDNPLLWRSIVNRVWQYHFGRGLVDTPNDFGRMGDKPTHPELLDWLAVEFRDGGGSMKKLHKVIVTSDAYKRASSPDAMNEKLDSDNRYLWRQNRRKLEAEAVRDSILMAAGKLDLKMGGPSFQDFVIEKPEHSPHYQYHLSDPDDVKTHRRAVYRFVVRSKQQPFLAALDCADPSLAVDKRNQTITPQQALALLNNKLTLAMAKHFATRVEKLATDDTGRVREAFRLAIGRDASEKEAELLAKHAKEHGLASACRAILNLNEFAFVD